jgi:hypothetical protein
LAGSDARGGQGVMALSPPALCAEGGIPAGPEFHTTDNGDGLSWVTEDHPDGRSVALPASRAALQELHGLNALGGLVSPRSARTGSFARRPQGVEAELASC